MVSQAYDLGEPPLSSETDVVVFVLDENDHAPQFDSSLYRKTIPEDTPPGTSVTQVSYRCRTHDSILPQHGRADIPSRLKPQDILLNALRCSGNVVEFQGKLEERSASALAHMTRIRTVKLYLASLVALKSFSISFKRLLILDNLPLHIHLPFCTPAARISRMVVFRRATVYLNL